LNQNRFTSISLLVEKMLSLFWHIGKFGVYNA